MIIDKTARLRKTSLAARAALALNRIVGEHNIIAHFDADAFFVSVEQALDPALRGKCVAVGGRTRGIIASASYEARARGVKTPMPTVTALRICPELILISGRGDTYGRFSEEIFHFARDITPMVEQTSVDEGYLDITPCPGDAVALMRGFAARIERELKITVSVGVAPNKLMAAVASKWKKPRGFTVIEPGGEAAFLSPLPVGVLPWVGPKTAERLRHLGFVKVGDIQAVRADAFARRMGGGEAEGIYAAAFGRDDRPVETEHAAPQSVSEQTTFPRDVGDFETVEKTLKGMLDRLLAQLRAQGVRAHTLTLRLRYPDWEQHTFAESLESASDLEVDFYPLVAPLLRKAWARPGPLRLVGIKLSRFAEGPSQGDLFAQDKERRRVLAKTSDGLNREARGSHPVILRASQIDAPAKKRAAFIDGDRAAL